MLQIHVHAADGDLNDDRSILLETFIADHLIDIFGDFVEVEIFPRAEETKIIFPAGTGDLTLHAVNILTASVVAAIDKEIEDVGLPVFSVTEYEPSGGRVVWAEKSSCHMHYREVLQRWPWLLSILPTVWEETYSFSLEWVSGLTKITIR